MRNRLQTKRLEAVQSNKPQRLETRWTFLLSSGSRVRFAPGAPFFLGNRRILVQRKAARSAE